VRLLLDRRARRFDAFVTVDRNLAFQQRIDKLPFAVKSPAGQDEIDWRTSSRSCPRSCWRFLILGQARSSGLMAKPRDEGAELPRGSFNARVMPGAPLTWYV